MYLSKSQPSRRVARLHLAVGLLVALALVSVGTASSSAQIVNGSFETGDLTGWTVEGFVRVDLEDTLAYAPPASGDYMANLTAGAWFAQTFAQNSISQSFTAGVGDTLGIFLWASHFDSEWDTVAGNPGGTGQTLITLTRPGGSVQTIVSTSNNISPYPAGPEDWFHAVVPIETAGEHLLSISSTAWIFQEYPHAQRSLELFVDNIGLNQITTEGAPMLPTQVVAGGGSGDAPLFVFNNVPSGQWFDPPMAEGFTYEMTTGSLFTGILDFPSGFNQPFTVLVDGTALGQFAPGDSVDFTGFAGGGVNSFQILGLDPGADPNSPTAFPLRLSFNTSTADFTMQAILQVPEPSTLALAAMSGVALLAIGRRKRCLT